MRSSTIISAILVALASYANAAPTPAAPASELEEGDVSIVSLLLLSSHATSIQASPTPSSLLHVLPANHPSLEALCRLLRRRQVTQ